MDKGWAAAEALLWARMMDDKAQRPQGLHASDKAVRARALAEWFRRQEEARERGWRAYREWITH